MQFYIDDMICGGCVSMVKKMILIFDVNVMVRIDLVMCLVDVEMLLFVEQIVVVL